MRLIYIITCIHFSLATYAQNTIQAIHQQLKIAKTDTAKAGKYYRLAILYGDAAELDSSQKYAELALNISTEKDYPLIRHLSAFDLCRTHIYKRNYLKAIDAGLIAVKYAPEAAKPSMYNRLAAAYYYNEDYEKAFHAYSQALQHHGDAESKVLAYNGIGNVFYAQNKFNDALKYYQLGYQVSKKTYLDNTQKPDLGIQANCLLNLANTQDNLNNSKEAIQLFKEAIRLYEAVKDDVSKALCFMNLGTIFIKQENYKNATTFFHESLYIFQKHQDKENAVLCLINLGYASFKENTLKDAEVFLRQGITLAKELGRLDHLKSCYDNMALVYATAGDYKKAYEYSDLYNKAKDSLNTKLYNERIAQQETIHKTKEKEVEIEALNLEKEKEKQRRYFLIAIIVITVIVSFFIHRQYRRNKQLNLELVEKNNAINIQKQEIEIQKTILVSQNTEITDSISYAKHIQSSLSPTPSEITRLLPQNFVLYKPKAIVSGDFYFVTEQTDKIIVAVVDCTGHGVPGAFMSIIGYNLLSHLIEDKGITKPEEILNTLHNNVRKLLHQEAADSTVRDGMDICLLTIDKSFHYLEYAGANRPLYHFRNGQLHEIKSDKFPIGGLQIDSERRFKNNRIDIQKGDMLYLFSDGYADQFGGLEGKKFMVKNLKQVFSSVCMHTVDQQKQLLENSFINWRGKNEQVDDVLVMGIKI